MNKVLIVVAAFALALLFITLAAYAWFFGSTVVPDHEKWGQFGDFLGGILNPVYALFAFLALLFTISLQLREFKKSTDQLSKSAQAAQEQLLHLQKSSLSEDIFRIVKMIDDDIDQILQKEISPQNAGERKVLLHLMVNESHRLKGQQKNGAYREFLDRVKDVGSIIEAHVNDLISRMEDLCSFLLLYEEKLGEGESPVANYFGKKNARLLPLIEDLGTASTRVTDLLRRYE